MAFFHKPRLLFCALYNLFLSWRPSSPMGKTQRRIINVVRKWLSGRFCTISNKRRLSSFMCQMSSSVNTRCNSMCSYDSRSSKSLNISSSLSEVKEARKLSSLKRLSDQLYRKRIYLIVNYQRFAKDSPKIQFGLNIESRSRGRGRTEGR